MALVAFNGASGIPSMAINTDHVVSLERWNNTNETPRLTLVRMVNGDKHTVAGELQDVAAALGIPMSVSGYNLKPYGKPRR